MPSLHLVPFTRKELTLCTSLWPDRAALADYELARVLAVVEQLLSERRAFGRGVMEGDKLRAYGISAFVHERFADEYLANPHPQMGKRLLLETPPRTILSLDEIADRNAGIGLQLVVLSANFDTTFNDSRSVLGALMTGYLEVHRGYRINRLVQEAIGEPASVVVTQGDSDVIHVFGAIAPGIPIPSAVVTLNRERAALRRSPFLSLFVYNPPRMMFTRAEQDLLLAALDGAPDDAISRRLGIPLSSVKARWKRIHERAADRVPELFEQTTPHRNDSARGRQSRHLILEYVRQTPSELTPYAGGVPPNPRVSFTGSEPANE